MDAVATTRRTPHASISSPLQEKPLVAIFDNTQEIIDTVDLILQDEGYRTIIAPLLTDLARDRENSNDHVQTILGNEKPRVFIIDIGAKHEREIIEYIDRHLLHHELLQDAKVILTSTDGERLEQMTQIYEGAGILPKPFNLNDLTEQVKKGLLEQTEEQQILQAEKIQETSQGIQPTRRSGKKKNRAKEQEPIADHEGSPMKES